MTAEEFMGSMGSGKSELEREIEEGTAAGAGG